MCKQILITFLIISTFAYSKNEQVVSAFQDLSKEKVLYEQATEHLKKSMPDLALPILFNLLDSVRPKSNIAIKLQISIAEGYREKREYKKGIDLLNSIIKLDSISPQNKAYACNRIAAIYNETLHLGIDRLDSVFKYSKQCLIISEKYKLDDLKASSQNELGYSYMYSKKPQLAFKFYKESYRYYLKANKSIYAANVAINLSNSLIALKQFEDANLVLDSVMRKLEEKDYRNMFMRLYLQKSSVYHKWGKLDSAYKYLSRGRIAQKHFFLDRMDEQIFEMSAKYDLELNEVKLREERLNTQNKQRENIYLLIIIGALIFVLLIAYFIYRLKRKNTFQKEKLSDIEHQILQGQLNFKNKELSTAIAHSVAYNEVLESVKKALSSKNKEDAVNIINANINTEQNWQSFLLNFNQLYPSFFSKLKRKHPNLTESETKLSALLMMNLKSKEISAILNIALSSVNKNRQRLRKKLKLQAEMDINLYLSKL